MEGLTPILGGAIGGAIITGIFVMVKTLMDRKHEHRTWLRDRKFELYTGLLQFLHSHIEEILADPRLRRARGGASTLDTASVQGILLIAGWDLRAAILGYASAIERLSDVLGDKVASDDDGLPELHQLDLAIEEVMDATRRELNIPDYWDEAPKTRKWKRG